MTGEPGAAAPQLHALVIILVIGQPSVVYGIGRIPVGFEVGERLHRPDVGVLDWSATCSVAAEYQ